MTSKPRVKSGDHSIEVPGVETKMLAEVVTAGATNSGPSGSGDGEPPPPPQNKTPNYPSQARHMLENPDYAINVVPGEGITGVSTVTHTRQLTVLLLCHKSALALSCLFGLLINAQETWTPPIFALRLLNYMTRLSL